MCSPFKKGYVHEGLLRVVAGERRQDQPDGSEYSGRFEFWNSQSHRARTAFPACLPNLSTASPGLTSVRLRIGFALPRAICSAHATLRLQVDRRFDENNVGAPGLLYGSGIQSSTRHRPSGGEPLLNDRSGEDPVTHGRAGSRGNAAYKPIAAGCRTKWGHSSSVVQGGAIQSPSVELHTIVQGLEQAVPSETGIAIGGVRPVWLQPFYGLPAWVMITVRPLVACVRIVEDCLFASAADMTCGMSLPSIERRWIDHLSYWSDAPYSLGGFQSCWKMADYLFVKYKHITLLVRRHAVDALHGERLLAIAQRQEVDGCPEAALAICVMHDLLRCIGRSAPCMLHLTVVMVRRPNG